MKKELRSECVLDHLPYRKNIPVSWVGLILVLLALTCLNARSATVMSHAPNATVYLGLPIASLEFENPLSGVESVLGHQVLEWRDADFVWGPPHWYDDWSVVDTNIDGSSDGSEIYLRMQGHAAWTTTATASALLTIHMNSDTNDGIAAVAVDGLEVARLNMYTAPCCQTVLIVVKDLPNTPHTVTIKDLGSGTVDPLTDDVHILGAAALKESALKWNQPPVAAQPTNVFYGWNDQSVTNRPPIVADDWVCTSQNPVTKIRWWGSFANWASNALPPFLPNSYQITIWTDTPSNPADPLSFSHPGMAIWQTHCANAKATFVGWDYDPRVGQYEACFLFEQELAAADYFTQPGPVGTVYWISIAGEYSQGTAGPWPWGWKSRPRDPTSLAPDDAVRIAAPLPWQIVPGTQYEAGEPIFWPFRTNSWDMSFELVSDFTSSGAKWEQRPDLSPLGMDVKDSVGPPPPPILLADDFRCTSTGPITNVTIWGSWRGDVTPGSVSNVVFTLSIHQDIPANDPSNPVGYSQPGALLWQQPFGPGQFKVFELASDLVEGWFEPPETYLPQGDTKCFQYDFDIPASLAFVQQGTATQPMVYWLDCQANVVQAGAELAQLGWKTCITNWNDTAVWAYATEPYVFPPSVWNRLLWMQQRPLDLAFRINAVGQTVHETKWSQPPVAFTPPDAFKGWNLLSWYGESPVAADDWVCTKANPVTDVHWWGSFIGWSSNQPPRLPDAFYLTIWTDVPADAGQVGSFSHPGTCIWMNVCSNFTWEFVGWDFDPRNPEATPEACFRFDQDLRETEWFQQASGTNVYWLSIAAFYSQPSTTTPQWGWKTRPRDLLSPAPDDAVLISSPTAPVIGARYESGVPIYWPTRSDSWDLAFALSTYEPPVPTLDFGDAPNVYPTLLANDGARHVVTPGVMLGKLIDAELNGQPNATATGDDVNNLADEDGVSLQGLLIPGESAAVKVTASIKGYLSAWFDFNANGSWADAGDQIFTNLPIAAGSTTLNFNIPLSAARGTYTFARFRFSSGTVTNFTGWAADGEVEDYAWPLEELDFGDAADPTFPTKYANSGARHWILRSPPVFLGQMVDNDPDGQPDASGTGDDIAGFADEDGVTRLTPLLPGQMASVQVVTGISNGVLNAWIDFAGDGSWVTPGDQIATNMILPVAGANVVSFLVPANAATGSNVFARFRFSTMGNLSYTNTPGLVPNGEVEDYRWRIDQLDFGDAPDPGYPTLLANNGARHVVGPLFLGKAIDAELNGQPSAHADGDDVNPAVGPDDEDGVQFQAALIGGVPNTITVTTSIGGYLQAWLDLNGDGDWADLGEQVVADKLLAAGANAVSFFPGAITAVDKTCMRFRLSGVTGLSYSGLAPDGEVEDYEIAIAPVKWVQRPDLTPSGVDVDNFWVQLADDFRCTMTGPITDIHLWGSFVEDLLPAGGIGSMTFTLFLYADVPADVDSTYSHPGRLLWQKTFGPGQYGFGHTFYQPEGEWWHDPASQSWRPAGDKNVYQFDFYVDPREAFSQVEGTIYWLGVKYTPSANDNFTFGWKTSYSHWNDDGCWFDTSVQPPVWRELRYGDGHPMAQQSDNSMDLAFAITGKQGPAFDFGDAPDGVAAPGYSTLLVNNGARHSIVPGVRLGNFIDAEGDGQPNAAATGDDITYFADEDGVALFGAHMIPGGLTGVAVTASTNGYVSAWVDFNRDGSWATGGDQIFTNVWVTNGLNNLYFSTPFAVPRATNTFARFRFSTQPITNFTGLAVDGEVEDYRWWIEAVDFGDAPEPSYPTKYANAGAYHWLMPGVFLGAVVDAESDGQPNANATGDDLTGLADEDGVIPLTPLVPGALATVQVTASLSGAWLNAWVDFGGDGSWATPGDQIIVNASPIAGLNNYSFLVPANAPAGSNIFARFRFSTVANLSFVNTPGQVPNGEVEDHQWRISQLDFGDAPDPKFPTLQANDGARHVIGRLFLGATVDAESDGQPDVYAAGDDKSPPTGPNDEDGVSFPTALIANAPATIRVISSGPGILQGWFDFDGDGTWTNVNEHPISNYPVVAGVNTIQIFVPNAVPGRSYARFRLSTQRSLPFTGLAPDGEIEDYAVNFQPLKWNQPPEQGPEGVDVYDGVPLADDFLCRQSGPITDFHIWGSFRNDLLPFGGPGSMNITLTIYADVPAGASYSHPGQALWSRTFAPGQFSAGLCMLNASEWYHDPRLPQPIWQAAADTNIWQFDFYLAATNAFQQVSNTVYWLGVQYKPLDNDNAYLFGWKTTYLQWNDAACWFNSAAGSWMPLLYGDGHPRASQQVPMNQMDFAFALSGEQGAALDFGDAPDGLAVPGYPTLLVNNGARHTIVPGLMLGNAVDAEGNGQPDPNALGDDNNPVAGVDDEDGVIFPVLVPGQQNPLQVTVTGNGILNAWMDFGADGSWAQAGDQIFTNVAFATGVHTLNFNVPSTVPWGATTFARIRFSTASNLSYVGAAPDGEVEDHQVYIHPLPNSDVGDAPDSSNHSGANMTAYPKGGPPGVIANYPTVFGAPAPFGPHHVNTRAVFLGPASSGELEADVLADQDFINNLLPAADKPDLDAADDGLIPPILLPHCGGGAMNVAFTWLAGVPPQMFLNIWCDWNRDGDWNDTMTCPDGTPATEWACQNLPVPIGIPMLPVAVKSWHPSLEKKPLWIRITLAEQPWPGPAGFSGAGGDGPQIGYQFGETEDYYLTDYDYEQKFDFGDAPAPHPTLLANNGAQHLIVPNFRLGNLIDDEVDGLPHALALGDDNNNLADEDGVQVVAPVLVNTQACVNVFLTGTVGGKLDGWLDLNKNGVWESAERIFNGQALVNGANPGLCFALTNTTRLGTNYARFRLSSLGGLSPTGVVQDGEVEDYQVILHQRAPTTNIIITWIGVTNTTPTNQVVTMKWNAETNVHYELLATPSLGTNSGTDIVWSVISPEIIGPNNQFVHTNTSTSQRYYRVRAPWTYP